MKGRGRSEVGRQQINVTKNDYKRKSTDCRKLKKFDTRDGSFCISQINFIVLNPIICTNPT